MVTCKSHYPSCIPRLTHPLTPMGGKSRGRTAERVINRWQCTTAIGGTQVLIFPSKLRRTTDEINLRGSSCFFSSHELLRWITGRHCLQHAYIHEGHMPNNACSIPVSFGSRGGEGGGHAAMHQEEFYSVYNATALLTAISALEPLRR